MTDLLPRISAALFLLGLGSGIAAAQDTNPVRLKFSARLETHRSELIEVRRDLHRHPEISGQEVRTARIIAERLGRHGFSVRTGVGGHGVVGLLRGGKPGPAVAFRADMDAVRSSAPDPVEFRSLTPGVRHICGHDIHTTIGLALADGFSAIRDELSGSVMLIFQPAEERATGARAMLADDVFGQVTPDAIFAFHTAPMKVGQVATANGTLMAWRDRVRVIVSGQGDLKSAAEEVRRRIQAVATLTPGQAVQPASPEAILVQAGSGSRTASGDQVVLATISTGNPNAKRLVEEQLAQVELDNVSLGLEYEEKWVAGVTNDPSLVERATRSVRSVLGDDGLILLQQVVPAFSEDFGSFQQQVPGVMFFLGVSNPEQGWVGLPHSPDYIADEESILVGARLMGRVMVDFLEGR